MSKATITGNVKDKTSFGHVPAWVCHLVLDIRSQQDYWLGHGDEYELWYFAALLKYTDVWLYVYSFMIIKLVWLLILILYFLNIVCCYVILLYSACFVASADQDDLINPYHYYY